MTFSPRNSSAVITNDSRRLTKLLDAREALWISKQEELSNQKRHELFEKKLKEDDRIRGFVIEAEAWGGPFQSSEKIDQLMESGTDEQSLKRILRIEMLILKAVAKLEGYLTSKGFGVNSLTSKQLADNLKTHLEDLILARSEHFRLFSKAIQRFEKTSD